MVRILLIYCFLSSAVGVSLSGSKAGKLVAWEKGLNLGLAHIRLEPYLRHTLLSPSTAASSTTNASGGDDDGGGSNNTGVRSESAMSSYKSLHNRCVGGRSEGMNDEDEGKGHRQLAPVLDLSIDAGGREESLYRVCPILPVWWTLVKRPTVPEE
jgi:hypothetical protein